VEFRPALPKASSNKILRRLLRQMVIEEEKKAGFKGSRVLGFE